VLVSESTWEDKPRNRVLELVKKWIITGCGAAFVGGQPQARYLRRLGFPEASIFHGCGVVDNRHFASAKRKLDRQGRSLLTVCRIVPEKNLLLAARAFLRFAAERPANEAWHWTIVGYGSQVTSLRELASRSRGRISIEDFKSYDELPAIYADADLYFHPSIYEPWGLVVNEAMAAGLPVLVSRKCGCVDDLVHPEVGWVFDPHSEEAIMAGLHAAALGFDRWQTMGEAAAIRIGTWGLDLFSNSAVRAAQIAIGQHPG
jgi:glycosyltransferase involved in cell wall biosynthesis